MKKKVIFVILCIAAPISFVSAAESNKNHYYIRGDIGYGMTKHHVNTTLSRYQDGALVARGDDLMNKKGKGFLGSFGIGYHIMKNLRLEGQFYFDDGFKIKQVETDPKGIEKPIFGKHKDKTVAGFVNGYYDFSNSNRFVPYVMAGIGVANNKSTFTEDNNQDYASVHFKKKMELAYQLGLGAYYKITDRVSMDLSYRLMSKSIHRNNKAESLEVKDLAGVSRVYNYRDKNRFNQTFLAGVRYTF
jgi:opacity protein-like surface antigen